MRRFSAGILVAGVVLLVGCRDGAGPAGDPSSPALSEGQVVVDRYVVLVGEATDAARVAQEHGLTPRHVYGAAVRGFAATVPPGRLNGLRADPRVQRVEEVRVFAIAQQSLPTGIDRIETDRNPTADVDGTDDARVNKDVAIIDTGIDSDHPDLNIGGGINFTVGGSANWEDGNGHGTHVAGTVAAIDNGSAVVGVAPGARVWAVRVCGPSGFCFTDDLVAGIDWVADRKADFKAGVSGGIDFASANYSISSADDANQCSSSSGAVHLAICGLVNEGVVFVMAAGNDGRLKEAFPEAFAVSALADFDGRGGGLGSPTCRSDEDETLANFSNFGPSVDIAAPGVCILSTWNDGTTNTISGTSMATPHVTGAVALYLEANGLAPATDAAGVGAIRSAIANAALAQSDPCGYTNEHAGEGSDEPLLFVNATAFGGDGGCDDGSGGGETNAPPTASFTFACTDLACDFDGSGSTDSDGSIASYTWDFGDGSTGSGVTVSHTYETDGTFTVTLTVTDDDGATDSESQNVTVGTTDGISLTATGFKVRGLQKADLEWSGATSTNIDVYRDGTLIATTENDGFFTDNIDQRGSGSYTYQVCEAGTSTCSNTATVTF